MHAFLNVWSHFLCSSISVVRIILIIIRSEVKLRAFTFITIVATTRLIGDLNY